MGEIDLRRASALVILTLLNTLSSVATLVLVFGSISLAQIGTSPAGQEWLPLIIIITFILMIDILKWIASYRISFKYSKWWLIFYVLYSLFVLAFSYIFRHPIIYTGAFLYALITFVLFYYRQQEIDTFVLFKKEKQDKVLFLALVMLAIPTLYQIIKWGVDVYHIISYPVIFTFPQFMMEFIFLTIIIIYSLYGLNKLRQDASSVWIHFYLGLFSLQTIYILIMIFLKEKLFSMLGIYLHVNLSFYVYSFILMTFYIVGYLVFIMRRDKLVDEQKNETLKNPS